MASIVASGVAPSSNGTVAPVVPSVVVPERPKKDILEDPFDAITENIRAHRKILKEKEEKIFSIQKRAKDLGLKMTAAETVECSKLPDLQEGIRRNDEVMDDVKAARKEYLSANAERVKNGKDDRQIGFYQGVQLIRRVLYAREAVGHAFRPMVRKALEDGHHGAPKLEAQELEQLIELEALFNVSSEGCKDNDERTKKFDHSSEQLFRILHDKDGEDPRRTVLNRLISSDYFDGFKYNGAYKKEKKDKRKAEKVVERKMRAEDPPVTFLKPSDLAAAPPFPPPSFIYDDSLPHPNQIFFNGTHMHMPPPPPGLMQMMPPMQQLQQRPLIMGPPPHLAHMHMGPPPMLQQQLQQLQQMPPMSMPPPMGQAQPLMQQQLPPPVPFPNGEFPYNRNAAAWEPPVIPATSCATGGGQVRTSPTGSKDGSGNGAMRGRGGHQRNFQPRPNNVNNFNQYTPPMAHFNPPFGMLFPNNGVPFQNNGFRGIPNQQYGLNNLTNGMGQITITNALPHGLPQTSGLIIPPTTSVNSNGQPFRRPNYRPAYQNNRGRGGNQAQNGSKN